MQLGVEKGLREGQEVDGLVGVSEKDHVLPSVPRDRLRPRVIPQVPSIHLQGKPWHSSTVLHWIPLSAANWQARCPDETHILKPSDVFPTHARELNVANLL